ncbi:MAG TPA: TetR/AcrR family transcriptional regulator [Solirubrobacteraceae bacterium]|nr:TetR/AcrR family transcriptional regulator [Solirubrobacteraceae bacterium]
MSAPDGAAGAVAQQPNGSDVARTGGRSLEGEKAQRIIDAMRSSVARRGSAGSTFDHVSREAGVSRGLLHYYFGTKEQLLAETVRRDCELRLERLEGQLSTAKTSDDFISLLREILQETIAEDAEFITLIFELFTLSRRNPEIAAEYADLIRRTREHVARMLAAAEREGVLRLHDEPEAVAEILFSLGDGIALRMLSEPGRDFTATMRAAVSCARALLSD